MRERLRRYAEKYPDQVGRALRQETEIEATEVKRNTPVDKGPLRASIHVVGPIRVGNTIFCKIVAGGQSAPYALYVHEDLTAIHKVGRAKFIEAVIMESRPFMAARVARRVTLNQLNV